MRDRRREVKHSEIERWRKAVRYVNETRKKEGLSSLSEELEEINPPLTPEQEAKIPPVYLDMITFSKKIVNEKWAMQLAKDMLDWVRNTPNAIKINEFLVDRGIATSSFRMFCERYKCLREAYRFTLEYIGNTRERRMLEGDWNHQVGMFIMGLYDPDWKAEMDHRDAIKAKQSKLAVEDLTEILKFTLKPVAHTEEVARALLGEGINGKLS